MRKFTLLLMCLTMYVAMLAQAPSSDAIITGTPQGRAVAYSRSTSAYYVFMGHILQKENDETVGRVVYGDDNTVYFRSPFTQYPTDSWLKGTIDSEGTVTIPLPQPVCTAVYEGEQVVYYADRLVAQDVEESDINYAYAKDDSRSDIRFKLRNDSLVWDEESDGSVILGLTFEDGVWGGDADYNIVYAPVEDELVEIPDGTMAEDWIMSAGGDESLVKVMFHGDDCFIGKLYGTLPNAWVKGTRQGDKVTFKSYQYLGPDDDSGYHLYFLTAGTDPVWDDRWGQYVDEIALRDKIVFTIDSDRKTLAADNGDSTIIVNEGKKDFWWLAKYDAPVIRYTETIIGAATPAAPVIKSFMDYDPATGYGYIKFDLPKTDVDGHLLDTDKMHYNIFIDDEVLVLMPDEYLKIPEEMTDIPYSFKDNNDIYVNGLSHQVYFFTSGYSKIGVNSTYTADNGESATSETVWQYSTTVGIDTATTNEVQSVTYTDMTGRRVAQPAKGLYVKKTTYQDGKTEVSKVIKR